MARTSRQFSVLSTFNGYRNREDVTNLPPGILVPGSQNVLTNVSERVGIRKGYTLDGNAQTTTDPIVASYDWFTHLGFIRNLRAYGTELEYRYVDSDGNVTWRTLLTGTSSPYFNFTEFWKTSELIDVLLFVNGEQSITEWSGGIVTIASNTATTLTKEGTTTWAEEGFYTTGTRKVTIDGVDYTYTGGENTTTLTGLTALPTFTAGDICHQTPIVTLNSSMTSIALPSNDLISCLLNQIYIGSFTSRDTYISNVNSYTDYSFDSPRLVGQGGMVTLDATPISFIPQDNEMYMSAGKNYWYRISFETYVNTISVADVEVTTTYQTINTIPVKTTSLQSAQSQGLTTKIKNNIAFVSCEPTFDIMGKTMVQNGVQTSFLNDVTVNNISDPIKLDFDNYDFTDGHAFYHRYYTYISVPQSGVVRIYNHIKEYWEAPQILPVSRFYITDDGSLYGHSYNGNESYKLFDGTSDNGNPIDAVALFSFQNYGSRYDYKRFNEYYAEGYISSNTTLEAGIKYEVNGCGTYTPFYIKGTDKKNVCLISTGGALGKFNLGKKNLAGRGKTTSDSLPPKFRWKKGTAGVDFFEVQYSFSTNDIDQQWEILAFGAEVVTSDHDTVSIKK